VIYVKFYSWTEEREDFLFLPSEIEMSADQNRLKFTINEDTEEFEEIMSNVDSIYKVPHMYTTNTNREPHLTINSIKLSSPLLIHV
jgi:hypothetical protein